MITEKDLNEAIAECLGKRNPDASTCLKLAAFYTIRREMYGAAAEPALERHFADPGNMIQTGAYSFAAAPVDAAQTVEIDSDSEFAQAARGKPAAGVWRLVEELAEATSILQPRVYKAFIRDLEALR